VDDDEFTGEATEDSDDEGDIYDLVPKNRLSAKKLFDIPARSILKSHFMKLLERLCPELNVGEDDSVEAPPPKQLKTLEDKFQFAMQESSVSSSSSKSKRSIESILEEEMKILEKTKKMRGNYLSKIYDYIMTIRPTSIESERAFSVSGYMCSKIRSRFNDDTLDNLCFLRHLFRKIQKIEKK